MWHDQDSILTTCLRSCSEAFDMAFGFSLRSHVLAAYMFLMQHYSSAPDGKRPKITLIGHSRGSLTARVLAGMIGKVGLLRRGLEEMVPQAWALYSGWELQGQPLRPHRRAVLAGEFKLTFCHSNARIHFVGVCDTVNSVGFLADHNFPCLMKSSVVDHVRHAVSVDERRSKFRPMLFVPDGNAYSVRLSWLRRALRYMTGTAGGKSADIVEMWFPGDHGDIGGGHREEHEGGRLSDIVLRWLIHEAIALGVQFNLQRLREYDQGHSARKALYSEDHDQLIFPCYQHSNALHGKRGALWTLFWWIVELLPFETREEDTNGVWFTRWFPNYGRPRVLPKSCVFHWSLFYRLRHVPSYLPKNVPHDIGALVLRLLDNPSLTDADRKYIRALTLDTIRHSDHPIWDRIPHDLRVS